MDQRAFFVQWRDHRAVACGLDDGQTQRVEAGSDYDTVSPPELLRVLSTRHLEGDAKDHAQRRPEMGTLLLAI